MGLNKRTEKYQYHLPIISIENGVVLNGNNQFVKIMEVKSVPFFLMNAKEQNRIADNFESLLKIAPDDLHIKCISTYANTECYINSTKENLNKQNNLALLNMGKQYLERLESAQRFGVDRKFFISFPYQSSSAVKYSGEQIALIMEGQKEKLSSLLKECENETKEMSLSEQDINNIKILFQLYNRNEDFEKTDRYRFIRANNLNSAEKVEKAIAPRSIDYTNARLMKINERYYSFLYIDKNHYDRQVIAGWLNGYINSYEGVDVDILLKRYKKSEILNKIKHSISYEKTNVSDSNEMDESYDNSLNAVQSGYYIKEGLMQGQDFYHVAVILTVSDNNQDELEEKIENLQAYARTCDMELHRGIYQNEEFFNICLPTAFMDNSQIFEKMKRNVLSEGAASLYPFTSHNIQDENGVYLCDDLSTNTPVIIDFFNRARLINPHLFVCGSSGSGKTVTLSLLSTRSLISNPDSQVMIIAPEKEDELRRLTGMMGGQFVSIGPGSKDRINIMDIIVGDECIAERDDLIDGTAKPASYLQSKLSSVMDFLQLHLGNIPIREKQLLNEALTETYRRFGMTEDNNSLFETNSGKIKEMPILADLVCVLEENEETKDLATSVRYLTTGSGAYFNGKTNVDISNRYFVIGLQNNGDSELPLAIYLAMELCWKKIREDKLKKKIFVCDEWWRFAYNPIAARKSLHIAKVARAYSCSCVFATQSMEDIFAIEDGKYGKAVLNNCATKIILRSEDKDVDAMSNIVDLSENEIKRILKSKAGQALMISGNNRLMVQFNPNPAESLLMFSDDKTIETYLKIRQDEIKRAHEEEYELDNEFVDFQEYQRRLSFINDNVYAIEEMKSVTYNISEE